MRYTPRSSPFESTAQAFARSRSKSGQPTSAVIPSVAAVISSSDARAALTKPGPEEQILGRIPRDGELGEEDEVGSGGARLADRVDDERPVPGEIADDGVDLREREPHRRVAMFLTARHKLHSTFMLTPLIIARRFRGPRTSANGGYASGLLAQAARELGIDAGHGSR